MADPQVESPAALFRLEHLLPGGSEAHFYLVLLLSYFNPYIVPYSYLDIPFIKDYSIVTVLFSSLLFSYYHFKR